jgi:hypothetical protein
LASRLFLCLPSRLLLGLQPCCLFSLPPPLVFNEAARFRLGLLTGLIALALAVLLGAAGIVLARPALGIQPLALGLFKLLQLPFPANALLTLPDQVAAQPLPLQYLRLELLEPHPLLLEGPYGEIAEQRIDVDLPLGLCNRPGENDADLARAPTLLLDVRLKGPFRVEAE